MVVKMVVEACFLLWLVVKIGVFGEYVKIGVFGVADTLFLFIATVKVA